MTGEKHEDRDIERTEARKPGVVSRFSARQVLWAALAAIALWFAFSNGQDVKVEYFFGEASQPLWLVIILSIGVGMLLDRGLVVRGRRKKRD